MDYNYDYVIELAQIRKHDVRKAGGKGANLGEMIEMEIQPTAASQYRL